MKVLCFIIQQHNISAQFLVLFTFFWLPFSVVVCPCRLRQPFFVKRVLSCLGAHYHSGRKPNCSRRRDEVISFRVRLEDKYKYSGCNGVSAALARLSPTLGHTGICVRECLFHLSGSKERYRVEFGWKVPTVEKSTHLFHEFHISTHKNKFGFQCKSCPAFSFVVLSVGSVLHLFHITFG